MFVHRVAADDSSHITAKEKANLKKLKILSINQFSMMKTCHYQQQDQKMGTNNGKITHLIASSGTGGTISGIVGF